MNKKMADVDIDPFRECESRYEEPTDENIPLDPSSGTSGPPVTPVGGGRSTWDPSGVLGPLDPWEPKREQETSFGGRESQRTKLMKDYVKDLYKKLTENIGETPELFH